MSDTITIEIKIERKVLERNDENENIYAYAAFVGDIPCWHTFGNAPVYRISPQECFGANFEKAVAAKFVAAPKALGVPNSDDSLDIYANVCDCASAVLDTVAERR